MEPMSEREAFVALIGNTFNTVLADAARLRQQIVETTCLLKAVPVKKLYYPRVLAKLADVREAILAGAAEYRKIP
jgi:hypothetical protein